MYRFAFDLGSGSLGWAVFELDNDSTPIGLADLGVRMADGSPVSSADKSIDERSVGLNSKVS